MRAPDHTHPRLSSMNATLRERLIRAEQQFLLAVVSNDEESLEVFFQKWSQLGRDAENTKAAGLLDDDATVLLSKVSRAIESTTLCILESGAILQESLTRSIADSLQNIPFDDPSTASLHSQAIAPRHLLFSDLPSSAIPKILGQKKLLDSYAYSWLMQKIHNPYPNSAQMRIIGDLSDTSAVQVELWFQEVRDSIGWSELSRDFFAGSVHATVAAARRVFLERDKNISFDIVFAFTTVKASAETLFLDCPPLQGKNADTGSIAAIRTIDTDQDHMGSSPGDYINSPDSILVRPQVNLRALEPLSDVSDSDESEEEDTTPPPSIAGCKRHLAEDGLTLQAEGLGRPQKRRRTHSIYRTHSSKPECLYPSPSTLGLSFEQTISYISATPVLPLPSSHPLSPTSPASLPDPSPSISQKRGRVEDTLEFAEGPIHVHVPIHGIRKRRLSQCVSPSPSKRQRRPTSFEGHSVTNHMPPSDGYRDLSTPQGRPPDPGECLQPTLQVPLDSNIPLDIGVFDWNWISDPLVESAPTISQPAVVYVPSSDLSSQLLEPPDFVHDATFTSGSSSDLDSLQDLSSMLQFPMPAGPDLSASFASLDDSSFSSENLDWSIITEFNNLFPPDSTPDSTQWPSLSTSSSGPPTLLDKSFEPLPSSQPSGASEHPLSNIDSSVPPSVFLPLGSNTFIEDMNNMCSLLPGEYGDPVAHTLFRGAC